MLAVTGRPWDTNTGGQLLQAAVLELLLEITLLEMALLEATELELLDGIRLLELDDTGLLELLDGTITLLDELVDELPAVAGASLLYSITRKLSK